MACFLDDKGEVIGVGHGVVWSPAVLAAEIDTGLIQGEVAEALRKEGINTAENIPPHCEAAGLRASAHHGGAGLGGRKKWE
jgi:hypothetical protein